MSTFANSEDPDEMQHNAAFHQGLHCLFSLKRSSDKKKTIFFENHNLTPLETVKVKKIFRQKIQYFFENHNLTSLDIISNQGLHCLFR